MKEILKLAYVLFKLLLTELQKAKRKKNKKEISDVRTAIKDADVTKLRDLIIGTDNGDK